jgi:Flp pilus assembly pilin Flp
MSEYIIMVGLVAIAAIGIYTIFGNQVREAVATIGLQLSGDTTAEQEYDVSNYEGQDADGKQVDLGAFNN